MAGGGECGVCGPGVCVCVCGGKGGRGLGEWVKKERAHGTALPQISRLCELCECECECECVCECVLARWAQHPAGGKVVMAEQLAGDAAGPGELKMGWGSRAHTLTRWTHTQSHTHTHTRAHTHTHARMRTHTHVAAVSMHAHSVPTCSASPTAWLGLGGGGRPGGKRSSPPSTPAGGRQGNTCSVRPVPIVAHMYTHARTHTPLP